MSDFTWWRRGLSLVLAHAYEASSLGRSIHSKTREARVELVLQALGGKALNTLKARVRVSSNMIAWGVSQNLSVFPIDEQVILEYTDHLVKEGAKFSALTGVIETCQFLHHVLGVDLVPRALSHPLVLGRIRKAKLDRPPRKQARPFKSIEVAALELFVKDASRPCHDRFAARCHVVCRVQQKQTWGPQIHKGPRGWTSLRAAQDTSKVTSLSHKTRSMGNALGFELPLIAPVQGITESPWGPAWLSSCDEAGCSFKEHVCWTTHDSVTSDGRWLVRQGNVQCQVCSMDWCYPFGVWS